MSFAAPPPPEPGRKSELLLRFFDPASVDEAIACLAATQHAVLGLSQVTAFGITARAVQLRAAAGRLHRIHRGVYSLVPRGLLTPRGHWMAAVLACGPGAVLSHQKAAALHGLRPSARAKIDVTVVGRAGRDRPGIDIHRVRTLTPADVTTVDNIPCTSVARTLFDLAEVIARRPLERAFDQSEVLQVFDLRAMDDQIARNRTRPGAGVVKSLLDEHYVGSTLTQSELEEAFYALCRAYRLPRPKVNEWVNLNDGEPMIWADFVWRPQQVIVETDGKGVHGTHQARERDPRRDQRAMVAGWKPIRTTSRQVTRRPDELGPTLVKLLGATG